MPRKKPDNRSRNLLHDHPLLRKGGSHGKTRKAHRREGKMDLRREWGPHNARHASATPAPLSVRAIA